MPARMYVRACVCVLADARDLRITWPPCCHSPTSIAHVVINYNYYNCCAYQLQYVIWRPSLRVCPPFLGLVTLYPPQTTNPPAYPSIFILQRVLSLTHACIEAAGESIHHNNYYYLLRLKKVPCYLWMLTCLLLRRWQNLLLVRHDSVGDSMWVRESEWHTSLLYSDASGFTCTSLTARPDGSASSLNLASHSSAVGVLHATLLPPGTVAWDQQEHNHRPN